MKSADVERELREKTAPFIAEDSFFYVIATPDELVSVLLPWVMEMREEAAMQERIDAGELP